MTPTAAELVRREAEREPFRQGSQGLNQYIKYLRAEGRRIKAPIGAPTTGDAGFSDLVGVPDASPFAADIERSLIPSAIDPARVRFHVRAPILSNASTTAEWVPQGHAAAVTSFSASYARVAPAKVTTLAVVPKEVLESTGAISDATMLALLRSPVVRKVNGTFLSAAAAVAGESPAGIVNGVTAITATGTQAADLDSVIEAADTAGADLSRVVWVLSPGKAASYAAGLGLQNLGLRGGELLGAPAFTAPEAGDDVYLIDPTRIALAMAEVEVEVTAEATVEMLDSAPTQDATAGTGASLVSLFQTDSVGYLVRLNISWEALAGAAQVLSPAP